MRKLFFFLALWMPASVTFAVSDLKQSNWLTVAKPMALDGGALPPIAPKAFKQQALMEIYQLALANDPVLASALSGNQSAHELIEQSNALYRPKLNLSAGLSQSKTDIKFVGVSVFRSDGRQYFSTRRYGLEARQPIFNLDSWVKIQQAKEQVSQADKQYYLSQQDLMVRVTEAYFDVLIAQDQIDLIEAQKKAILGQLDQAQANFKVGSATVTDVNEAQARFDLVIAQQIAAENNYLIAKRALQAMTHQEPYKLAKVKSDLPVTPLVQSIDDWEQVAIENNLNVQIQQDNVNIAQKQISAANAGHLPTLDAVASFSSTIANGGVNGFGNNLDNTTIGVELNLPLYLGGAISSSVRQAVYDQQKAQNELDVTLRNVSLEAQRNYLNLSSSIAQVKALERAMASSQSQLDSTTLGYEVGVRTSIDVLDAQQQLFSAKRDLLQARYDYLVNIIRLKFVTGLVSVQDLEEINRQLVMGSAVDG